MSFAFLLRNRFNTAAVASALLVGLASAGCGTQRDYIHDQREQAAIVQQLEERYPASSRLRAILEEQKEYSGDADRVKFLVARGIDLELSADGLPDAAVIRLFKNRWQINPFLTAGTQSWALNLAIAYAQGQDKERLPYGIGESFAVGNRVLSPVGSIPLAAPQP
jgi:hypothetical protein